MRISYDKIPDTFLAEDVRTNIIIGHDQTVRDKLSDLTETDKDLQSSVKESSDVVRAIILSDQHIISNIHKDSSENNKLIVSQMDKLQGAGDEASKKALDQVMKEQKELGNQTKFGIDVALYKNTKGQESLLDKERLANKEHRKDLIGSLGDTLKKYQPKGFFSGMITDFAKNQAMSFAKQQVISQAKQKLPKGHPLRALAVQLGEDDTDAQLLDTSKKILSIIDKKGKYKDEEEPELDFKMMSDYVQKNSSVISGYVKQSSLISDKFKNRLTDVIEHIPESGEGLGQGLGIDSSSLIDAIKSKAVDTGALLASSVKDLTDKIPSDLKSKAVGKVKDSMPTSTEGGLLPTKIASKASILFNDLYKSADSAVSRIKDTVKDGDTLKRSVISSTETAKSKIFNISKTINSEDALNTVKENIIKVSEKVKTSAMTLPDIKTFIPDIKTFIPDLKATTEKYVGKAAIYAGSKKAEASASKRGVDIDTASLRGAVPEKAEQYAGKATIYDGKKYAQKTSEDTKKYAEEAYSKIGDISGDVITMSKDSSIAATESFNNIYNNISTRMAESVNKFADIKKLSEAVGNLDISSVTNIASSLSGRIKEGLDNLGPKMTEVRGKFGDIKGNEVTTSMNTSNMFSLLTNKLSEVSSDITGAVSSVVPSNPLGLGSGLEGSVPLIKADPSPSPSLKPTPLMPGPGPSSIPLDKSLDIFSNKLITKMTAMFRDLAGEGIFASDKKSAKKFKKMMEKQREALEDERDDMRDEMKRLRKKEKRLRKKGKGKQETSSSDFPTQRGGSDVEEGPDMDMMGGAASAMGSMASLPFKMLGGMDLSAMTGGITSAVGAAVSVPMKLMGSMFGGGGGGSKTSKSEKKLNKKLMQSVAKDVFLIRNAITGSMVMQASEPEPGIEQVSEDTSNKRNWDRFFEIRDEDKFSEVGAKGKDGMPFAKTADVLLDAVIEGSQSYMNRRRAENEKASEEGVDIIAANQKSMADINRFHLNKMFTKTDKKEDKKIKKQEKVQEESNSSLNGLMLAVVSKIRLKSLTIGLAKWMWERRQRRLAAKESEKRHDEIVDVQRDIVNEVNIVSDVIVTLREKLESIDTHIIGLSGISEGILSALGGAPEYASGGIHKGSKKGDVAILHGTEAVIPMPGGEIPIGIRGADIVRPSAEDPSAKSDLKERRRQDKKELEKTTVLRKRETKKIDLLRKIAGGVGEGGSMFDTVMDQLGGKDKKDKDKKRDKDHDRDRDRDKSKPKPKGAVDKVKAAASGAADKVKSSASSIASKAKGMFSNVGKTLKAIATGAGGKALAVTGAVVGLGALALKMKDLYDDTSDIVAVAEQAKTQLIDGKKVDEEGTADVDAFGMGNIVTGAGSLMGAGLVGKITDKVFGEKDDTSNKTTTPTPTGTGTGTDSSKPGSTNPIPDTPDAPKKKGVKGLLSKGGKALGKGARVVGKIAAKAAIPLQVVMSALDFHKAYSEAADKYGEDIGTGMKVAAGASATLKSFTFGIVDIESFMGMGDSASAMKEAKKSIGDTQNRIRDQFKKKMTPDAFSLVGGDDNFDIKVFRPYLESGILVKQNSFYYTKQEVEAGLVDTFEDARKQDAIKQAEKDKKTSKLDKDKQGLGVVGKTPGVVSNVTGVGDSTQVAEKADSIASSVADTRSMIPGFKGGGIHEGSSEGDLAMLHGTEAIIPLGKGALPLVMQGGGVGSGGKTDESDAKEREEEKKVKELTEKEKLELLRDMRDFLDPDKQKEEEERKKKAASSGGGSSGGGGSGGGGSGGSRGGSSGSEGSHTPIPTTNSAISPQTSSDQSTNYKAPSREDYTPDKKYSKSDVAGIVSNVAKEQGISQEDFLRFTHIETGGKFDTKAHNKGSGAKGLFQFIPGTAKEYGIKGKDSDPYAKGKEFDPYANAEAAAKMYKKNKRSMKRMGKTDSTGSDMYIAHQQGMAGYRSIHKGATKGKFTRDDTRGNIMSNISARDAEKYTGMSKKELRGSDDKTLAKAYLKYWKTKFNKIKLPKVPVQEMAKQSRMDKSVESSLSGTLEGANKSLYDSVQAGINKGIKYDFGAKNSKTGGIDCSGWVSEITRSTFDSMNKAAGEQIFDKKDFRALKSSSEGIIDNIANATGQTVLSNKELTPESLKEGMMIGIDSGKKYNKKGEQWDAGRKRGIDHIAQAIRDPETGEMYITESQGKRGVMKTKADKWLARQNKKGRKLFGVDPMLLADKKLMAAQDEKDKASLESREAMVDAQVASHENVEKSVSKENTIPNLPVSKTDELQDTLDFYNESGIMGNVTPMPTSPMPITPTIKKEDDKNKKLHDTLDFYNESGIMDNVIPAKKESKNNKLRDTLKFYNESGIMNNVTSMSTSLPPTSTPRVFPGQGGGKSSILPDISYEDQSTMPSVPSHMPTPLPDSIPGPGPGPGGFGGFGLGPLLEGFEVPKGKKTDALGSLKNVGAGMLLPYLKDKVSSIPDLLGMPEDPLTAPSGDLPGGGLGLPQQKPIEGMPTARGLFGMVKDKAFGALGGLLKKEGITLPDSEQNLPKESNVEPQNLSLGAVGGGLLTKAAGSFLGASPAVSSVMDSLSGLVSGSSMTGKVSPVSDIPSSKTRVKGSTGEIPSYEQASKKIEERKSRDTENVMSRYVRETQDVFKTVSSQQKSPIVGSEPTANPTRPAPMIKDELGLILVNTGLFG